VNTTMVGSYPKIPDPPAPGRWRTSVEKLQRGEITREDLHKVEDEITVDVLTEQADAGLDLLTDGQIRWEDGFTYFARGLDGFTINGLQRYFDTNVYYRQPVATGDVAWRGPITVADYQFAASHSVRPVKPVVTGPFTLAALSKDEFYGSLDRFVMALAQSLNQELRALAAAGAMVIQVDEPAILSRPDQMPLFRRAAEALWEGVNTTRAMYTYFGHLDAVYPAILDLPVSLIGVDFAAAPRNWDILRRAKFTKVLGAGILDARNTRVESPEDVAAACGRAAEIAGSEMMQIGPSAGLEFLPRRVARRKLQVLVNGVRLAKKGAA
jgi:5-methyltetrahydropteroyltriglutamate--homocysteine methyltransferase